MQIADEIWIATATLHQRFPEQPDFSTREIRRIAAELGFLRKGVEPHINTHCVANRPPNPGKYRALFETAPKRRRLFREGDAFDPGRKGGKIKPQRGELPAQYSDLLDWYDAWLNRRPQPAVARLLRLLELRGSGRDVWKSESADAFIHRLRSGW